MKRKSYVPKTPEASSYPVNLLSTPSNWRQNKKMTPKSLKDEMTLQYASGINLRITEPSERLKRAYSSLVNDHTYNKKVTEKKREKKIDRLDQYVTQALQDVCDTTKKKKTDEQIPDHVKGTQLYKYLITPVDNRPFRTENFGHFVMSERGQGKLPKVGVGISTTTTTTATTNKESTKRIRLTRLQKEKPKPPVVSVQPTIFETQLLQFNPELQQQQQLLLQQQQQQQQQQYSHIPQHIYYHNNNPCYGYSNYSEQESFYNDRLEQIIPQITFSPPMIDITDDDDDESRQLLPSFLMKPEAEWTFDDSNAYEIWWQNLPSCPYQRDGMFGMYYSSSSSSPVVYPSN